MSATQQTWWLFGGVFAILIFASTVGWLLQLRAAPGHAGIANLNARIKAWWVIVGLIGFAFLFGRVGVIVLFGLVSFFALREFITLTPSRPGDHLSLFLSFFVMAPVVNQINTVAIQPYAESRIGATDMIKNASVPLHAFMTKQTRVKDVTMFANIAKSGPYAKPADVPFSVLLPAFVTSELKTAFQIGFLVFLPFIVIDLVVATVLMSLGMMMMSPTMISMPFKLLLFVLVDGWALTMGSLANSFVS